MLATLDQAAEIEAAVRLVCARLCSAAWPRSAIAAEAKAAGVSEAAVNAALLAVGAVTVGGRLTLRANGHALESPIEEPAAAKDERAALVKACRLLREQLKEGPKPEAEIAVRFAEHGLRAWMVEAAERLGVRTQRGQWWLP
jgi:hypothetical protein